MEVALMRKSIAAAVVVVSMFTVLLAAFGTGVAGADDAFAGKTYAVAAKALDGSGMKAIIVTRVGNVLPDDQCVVTRSQLSLRIPQNRLTPRPPPAILLFLNCNAGVASAGTSGNSAASPEGRAAQTVQETADFINAHPEACAATAKAAADCKAFCDAHATLCTA
jgi:hypothetical protein